MLKAACRYWQGAYRVTCLISLICGLSAIGGISVSADAERVDIGDVPWRLGPELERIVSESCPNGTRMGLEDNFDLQLTPLSLSDIAGPAGLKGATLAGAWQLASSNPAFGGVSGLVSTPNGDLLAIGDHGSFLTLELDPERRAPTGQAWLAPLRDAGGLPLSNRRQRDAEGLAYQNGIAVVSFEHDHRILGYAIGTCGLNARGVDLLRLKVQQDGVRLRPNLGAEGLSLASDGTLRVGLEVQGHGGAVTGKAHKTGALGDMVWVQPPAFHLLTGIDEKDGLMAQLFRAYDPVLGNRISVSVSNDQGPVANIRLDASGPVDNFEGIAIEARADAVHRIWLISDDNFNRRQRTLLFAFDLTG